MSDKRLTLLVALCVGLLLIASYGPLMWAGHVWDDQPLIVQNTLSGDWSNLLTMFRVDLWQSAGGAQVSSGYYRPLVLVSFAVDRSLFGLWAGGHHLHSLAWHMLSSGLLLLLLRQLTSAPGALLGASLFALHPLQSEAVAWIAARNDLMVAALVIATLLLLVQERPSPWRLAAGGLCALAALLSKESAVMLPVLLVGLEWAQRRRLPWWPRVGVLLLALGCWIALRVAAGIESAALPDPQQLDLLLSSTPAILGHYTLSLLQPWPLSVGATLEYLEPGRVWGLLGLVSLGLVLLGKGGRLAWVGLLLVALSFGPAFVAIGVRGQLGERYLYLPLAGLALAVAAAIPADRRWLWGLPLLIAVHLLVVPGRVVEWRSERSLWTAAVETTPNGFSYASLGHILNMEGEVDAAAQLFRQALLDEPAYIEVCPHAVRVGLRTGRMELAVAGAAVVGQRCPADPELLGLVAITRLQTGDVLGARSALARWDGSPDSRLPLVAAAIARMDGDQSAYDAQRFLVSDPLGFDAQVSALLALSAVE